MTTTPLLLNSTYPAPAADFAATVLDSDSNGTSDRSVTRFTGADGRQYEAEAKASSVAGGWGEAGTTFVFKDVTNGGSETLGVYTIDDSGRPRPQEFSDHGDLRDSPKLQYTTYPKPGESTTSATFSFPDGTTAEMGKGGLNYTSDVSEGVSMKITKPANAKGEQACLEFTSEGVRSSPGDMHGLARIDIHGSSGRDKAVVYDPNKVAGLGAASRRDVALPKPYSPPSNAVTDALDWISKTLAHQLFPADPKYRS